MLRLSGSSMAAFALGGVILGQFRPPQYQSGSIPPTAIQALSGGQVLVEATITAQGVVEDVRPLRETPPFTADIVRTVRRWHFSPATQRLRAEPGEAPVVSPQAVRSKVLIAAWFRPPTINTSTPGAVPQDVAAPSEEIPFPITTETPIFPITAVFDGAVLLECRISTAGHVSSVRILHSGAVFDSPALDAVRKWTFRPARIRGVPSEAFVYISFGFRQPISTTAK
jgi:TonB family protein